MCRETPRTGTPTSGIRDVVVQAALGKVCSLPQRGLLLLVGSASQQLPFVLQGKELGAILFSEAPETH